MSIDCPDRTSSIVSQRVLGNKQLFIGIDGYTTFCTVRAPGPALMVQVGFPCGQNVGPVGGVSNTVGFNATLLAGLQLNNGRQLKQLGGVTPPIFQLTTGSTDIDDFSNPGGGAALFTITNMTGTDSAVPYNLKEGMVWSDWLTLPNECALGAPYVNVRCFSTSKALSLGNDSQAADYNAGEPSYWGGGYWTANNLASATADGGFANSPGYALSCTLRWLMAGQRGRSFLLCGDSMSQGYTGGVSASNPPGRISGYARKVRDALRLRGNTVDLTSVARVAQHSANFQANGLQELQRGGYTHAFIQAWSINDTLGGMATPYDVYGAILRVNQMLYACQELDTVPIVVEPMWNGTGQAVLPALGNFIDQLDASGVAVLRMPRLLSTGNKMTLQPQYDSGDGIHPNNLGQQVLADFILANAGYFGLD